MIVHSQVKGSFQEIAEFAFAPWVPESSVKMKTTITACPLGSLLALGYLKSSIPWFKLTRKIRPSWAMAQVRYITQSKKREKEEEREKRKRSKDDFIDALTAWKDLKLTTRYKDAAEHFYNEEWFKLLEEEERDLVGKCFLEAHAYLTVQISSRSKIAIVNMSLLQLWHVVCCF